MSVSFILSLSDIAWIILQLQRNTYDIYRYIQPQAMCIFLVHELTKMVGRCYAGFLYSCLVLFYAMKTMAYSSGAPSMTSVCEQRQPLHRSGGEIIQPQIGAPSVSMATDVTETSGGSVITGILLYHYSYSPFSKSFIIISFFHQNLYFSLSYIERREDKLQRFPCGSCIRYGRKAKWAPIQRRILSIRRN